MRLASRLVAPLAVAALCVPLAAQFGPQDFALSAPAAGAIWRVDNTANSDGPFATGFSIPHYGWFGADGNFYVPDRGWIALMKVMPDGTATPLTLGGQLSEPVTVIPTQDGQAWMLSDMAGSKIFRIGYDGSQTLLHDVTSTNGLLNWPDGMAWDDAGNLYVANLGNDTVIRIDGQGHATLLSDSPLIAQPGGVAVDGAGNLFVANYATNTIVRIRLDSGEASVFAGPDVGKIAHPNDLKLSRHGGLLTCGRQGSVCRIDALGNITVEFIDPNLVELDGVAVPEDSTLCAGRFTEYGAGQAGTGGLVPQFHAIFSPGPGQLIGLELRDFVGGAPAVMFVGSAALPAGAAKIKGASLLVDPTSALWLTLPLALPASGSLTMQFTVPVMPGLDGVELFHQVFAADPGAPHGISATNGLKEKFGL